MRTLILNIRRGSTLFVVPTHNHSSVKTNHLRLCSRTLFSTTTTTTASTTTDNDDNDKYYTIGITGSQGLVGTALRDEVRRTKPTIISNGKQQQQQQRIRVVRLLRSNQAEEKYFPSTMKRNNDNNIDEEEMTLQWNPNGATPKDIIHPTSFQGLDAIIHLSGENIATGFGPLGFLGIRPWTEKKKREIIDSRVNTTKALAKVIASSSSSPKTFLVASGVGAYGYHYLVPENNNNNDIVTAADETTEISNHGFLAHVSKQWEDATNINQDNDNDKQNQLNHRVVNMRFGVVLSKYGGALQKLLPIFYLGGGGIVGTGRQYFPFISARDHVKAIIHILQTSSIQGPVNICAPHPCTNAEFTKEFGLYLQRPTIIPLPTFMVEIIFGEMGKEMLLGGTKAIPKKLLDSGFEFQHPYIADAISSAMKESI